MPRTTNGIGTWFCKAHFDAGWGWDDAVECAMFVYFPVWAYRVVHVRETPGGSFAPSEYRAIPLRWSDRLVRHVFLRRWLSGFVGLGVLILFMLGLVALWPPTGDAAREWAATKPVLTPVAPCLVVVGLVGLLFLRPHALREREIRRVLGPHSLGTSDPASWVVEDLARMPTADALFGTPTYAEAVPALLAAGAYSGALWSARLATALEDRAAGEQLTDSVLRHTGTRDALSRFRRDPNCWPEAMGAQALARYRSHLGRAAGQGTGEGETEGRA